MDNGLVRELANSPRYLRFGPFQVDRQRQQVFRAGTRLRLQGKVYQVLIALIQRQGEIVTREELRQILWPSDTHVNYDANVNTTVNKLRQALGESTDRPAYIETIPRKGYSFIGSAEFSDAPFAVEGPAGGTPAGQATEAATEDTARANADATATVQPEESRRWLTWIIVTLIVAGVLLGAGAAMLWIARFAPHTQP